MKQLAGTNFNALLWVGPDGKRNSSVEVVIIVGETAYTSDGKSLCPLVDITTLRFNASPEALRKFADEMSEMADAVDKINAPYMEPPKETP